MTSLQTFIKERDTKMLEDFDSFLHENYPKELWGIVSFAMITDFLKSFRAKERQDLLALIAEDVGKMKEDYWVDFGEIRNAEKDGMNKVVEKVLTLLRSSLQ